MIEFACAETSAGRWLVFYGSPESSHDFAELNRMFERLRDGADEIVLSDLPFVQSVGAVRLVATLAPRGAGVTRLSQDAFVWSLSSPEWDDVVGLAGGLRGIGHQYLSRHPTDDAAVILSLGEYTPGWFSAVNR